MVLFKAKFNFQRRVKLAQTLWLLSWLAVLIGCLTFGIGIFLKVQLWIHNEIMDNTAAHAVPSTVITAGLVGILLGLYAGKISQDSLDIAKYPRWKPFMMPFFFVSVLSCMICLAALVLSVAMRGTLEESLKIGLQNGIRFYKDTDIPGRCYQKKSMDKLQMEYQCCGNNHYKDWFEVQWISNRYLDFGSKEVKDRIKSNVDGRYLMDSVPFSCCNPSSPRPCIHIQITNNSAHYSYNYQTDELNIWVRGCREVLLSYYTGIMATNGVAVTLSFILEVFVLVSLRYLQTSMDMISGPEDVEAESEGFLLEKGVGDTLNSTIEKTKALFKSNQVGTNGGVEATAS
ncbi:rod outer segment membrane protein 1 [Spea bombifrons]|uniref:rod outer segment membrane protein 1 n=1 Tax=Spea bombifrons TaxID=233779 RepID=UPI002349E102|nr:rod outer segment membrane protein 1 [Spea bombifrons]